jgi:hypothetical protein
MGEQGLTSVRRGKPMQRPTSDSAALDSRGEGTGNDAGWNQDGLPNPRVGDRSIAARDFHLMSMKDRLHQLVDELPEGQIAESAEQLLEHLRDYGANRLTRKLLSASIDDEPETEEERRLVQEAHDAIPAGDVIFDGSLHEEELARVGEGESALGAGDHVTLEQLRRQIRGEWRANGH